MSDNDMKNESWGKNVLQKLLFDTLNEQKSKRRWRIFFWLLAFGYLFFVTGAAYYGGKKEIYSTEFKYKEHTANIDIMGEIMDEQGVSAENVIKALQTAFKTKNCKGVVLRINSPGGSGVQSNQIYKEINRLRASRNDLPVYAVIEDIGASGAYLIASATDQIYADEMSIVGSIGTVMSSFGFTGAMEKIGVERRLYTAGTSKGMLDPFSPVKEDDVIFVKQQLTAVYKVFVENIKVGRKGRLADDESIYSGRFWSGEDAKNLGLIDGFGDVNFVAREVVKAQKVVDYTVSNNLFDRLAKKIGASMGNKLLNVGGIN